MLNAYQLLFLSSSLVLLLVNSWERNAHWHNEFRKAFHNHLWIWVSGSSFWIKFSKTKPERIFIQNLSLKLHKTLRLKINVDLASVKLGIYLKNQGEVWNNLPEMNSNRQVGNNYNSLFTFQDNLEITKEKKWPIWEFFPKILQQFSDKFKE